MADVRLSMRLFLNTTANVLGIGLPAIAALAAIPVLLGVIGLQLFGYFSIQLAILYFLGVADFGVSRSIVLSSTGSSSQDSWIAPYRVGMTYVRFLSLVIAALGVPVGLTSWALGLGGDHAVDLAVSTTITFMSAALSLASLPLRAILEVQNRFPLMNLIRGSAAAAMFLIPLAAIVFSPSLMAIALAIVLVRFLALVSFVGVTAVRQRGSPVRDVSFGSIPREFRREFLVRTGWIGVINTGSPLLGSMDRLFLGMIISASGVGQYALGQELPSKLSLLTGSAMAASLPRLVERRKDADLTELAKIAKASGALVVGLGYVPSILLIVFGYEILHLWLGQNPPTETTLTLQILAVGSSVNSLAQVNFALLQVFGGEREGALIQLVQLPLLAILLLVLVPTFGVVGASAAVAMRLVIDAVTIRLVLRKRFPPVARYGIGMFSLIAGTAASTILAIHFRASG
jgi:O-antigen/teichoic acid export membrane protein